MKDKQTGIVTFVTDDKEYYDRLLKYDYEKDTDCKELKELLDSDEVEITDSVFQTQEDFKKEKFNLWCTYKTTYVVGIELDIMKCKLLADKVISDIDSLIGELGDVDRDALKEVISQFGDDIPIELVNKIFDK